MGGNAYFYTLAGILKIIEELFNLIAFICVAAAGWSPRGDAFLVASVGAFLITGILLIIRVMSLDERITVVPWGKVELGYAGAWALFYLITASLVIDTGNVTYIAGGCFGLFATFTYIVDAYDKFRNDNEV